MADRWVPDTDHYPHRCRRTGHSGTAYGPYFHDEVPYRPGFSETTFDRDNPDRENVLYLSAQWVKDILSAAGSPFACLTTEEHQALLDKLAMTEIELAEARAMRDELEASFQDRLDAALKDRFDAADRVIDRLAGSVPPAPSEPEPAKATTRKAAAK